MKSYGIRSQTQIASPTEAHAEELKIRGLTLLENLFPESEVSEMRKRLDRVYEAQTKEMPPEQLGQIEELDVARCPLAYDPYFLKAVVPPRVTSLMSAVLGEYHILHLQNGVLNRSNQDHHQRAWHRDLPHQDFVSSKPLSLSFLLCLDDFNAKSGGTEFLLHSHRNSEMPSENFVQRHAFIPEVKAGSGIVFDSMVFHRAGINHSGATRRGLNMVYTIPLLSQQIQIPPDLTHPDVEHPHLSRLLGAGLEVPPTVLAYRQRRLGRKK